MYNTGCAVADNGTDEVQDTTENHSRRGTLLKVDALISGKARLMCLVMQNFIERQRPEPFRGDQIHSSPRKFLKF